MIFDYFYKRPYLLYSIIGAFFILGILGLTTLPKNLFPDANPPKVVVITSVPGATAKVVANSVSKPIEEEIARLGLIRTVSSVNVANMSIVSAEFEYEKGLDAAAVDTANALSIAKVKLPQGTNPAIYTAGDFTLPVEVIALSPKNDTITLPEIRKIADNFIKPYLLSNKSIGNIEIFGGYQGAITIEVDPFKANKYDVDFESIGKIIMANNRDIPVGFTKGSNSFYTVSIYGEKSDIEKLAQLQIKPNIRLSDIADVKWSYQKRTSGYLGDGKEAIAISVQRAPKGSVLDVSNAARAELEKLKSKYENINFSITDTQRELILTANDNMLNALKEAIILTLIVVMLFLGNFKAIIAAGITIPAVFFSTIAVIWLTGGELNIVIYTAIILALGLLTDNAVVVLENIERHFKELKEDLQTAIVNGTKEVVGPVWAGTIATIAIVFPLMFIGGFPEKIFKPLIITLIIALLASFFLSITLIPKILEYLYRNGAKKNRVEMAFDTIYEKTLGKLVNPYISLIQFSNNGWRVLRRVVLIGGVFFVLVFSVQNVLPTIGKDAMPPMDTGIIKAQVAFSANETTQNAQKRLKPFLLWLDKQSWVQSSSIAFGSEPGVLSLGSGNLPTEATITIIGTNRFERDKSMWELEDEMRNQLSMLEGVKKNDVFDFGATALSSIKAPLDIRIKSPQIEGLSEYSQKISNALQYIKGLTSISKSWERDFGEYVIKVDTNKALSYGTTPLAIAMQLPLKGEVVALSSGLESMGTQFVRLYLKKEFLENLETLSLFPIKTPTGTIPLSQIASIEKDLTYAKIERDAMLYSIDVNGYRINKPITHITDDAIEAIKDIKDDRFIITQEGDIAQIDDSFTRMSKAIGLGIVILVMILITIYRSVRLSLIMIVVLPLSMIGASWGMLLFNKPSCMPSMLGILLLFGIIIKNAILLIDFYQQEKERGLSPYESAISSVKARYRPVMMTAFATIAGMIPIALERAVGLERLSPLADVAIGGLLVGTLLTLVYVPMMAYMVEKK